MESRYYPSAEEIHRFFREFDTVQRADEIIGGFVEGARKEMLQMSAMAEAMTVPSRLGENRRIS
ncbi:MAG TPA: hypothetical protein PK364_00330 [Synergistaceae bacterium]|nr:hypothetical protein [Synergistaceae bacterium]HPJ25242.1 hypothetical protein [Synergistaceae bacterium]HPQ36113.1 hypothetical protein [Synergistaceae bacterium]